MTQFNELKVESEGITLPLLIWRQEGRQPPGYAERILDLNPGLAAHGPFLPVGTVVRMPIDEVSTSAASEQSVIKLWD